MNPFKEIFEEQKRHFRENIKNSSASERIEKIKKIRNWLLNNKQAIRDALYKDFKKAEVEVDISEIKAVLLEIDYAIRHLKKWMKPKRVPTPLLLLGTRSHIRYEPKGVSLIISPWNFPFLLSVTPLVSAIAAGNCVILKPSEISIHSSDLLLKMSQELFPAQEIKVVLGGKDVSTDLLKLPFNHIFFTGSTHVGKIVMKAAAENLSSVTLELGGQNPVIVDETARINDTAKRLIYGKFINHGQACVSINFTFVHRSIHDKLIQALKEELERCFPGNKQQNPDYARAINLKQFNHIKSLIDDAVDKGAQAVTDLNFDESDLFISPVILKETPLDARVFDEEIFGPLLPLTVYDKLDQVIDFINSKENPLALYIFSQSGKNISKILNHTSSGTAAINETTFQFGQTYLPFGGINSSGIGKSHGYHSFLEFSNERAILKQKNGFSTARLIQPPFNKKVKRIVKLILKYL